MGALAWGISEITTEIYAESCAGPCLTETAQEEGVEKKKDTKEKNKRHSPDQEALSGLVKPKLKGGVTNAEADTLLEWAGEYGFPARDDRGKDHWDGGEHIHLGPEHVKVRL